ncbi:hypothetical protein GCM10011344_46410 [Dokdonia pacifica]|uniref:Uncharacterized protein n=1 Tax=Dokdonia pacifica TaxID=1627892 RepID=A0A239DBI5_9FLAO|nr:hypothetical protein [Dokdonia pacifica]GGG40258.1 hypothetical protein GCM10011344_46410 [Dokdonia pacifica]SNS29053.1 hypothetical protein SAMN06265376_11061 [Dokdonia pacifica]
MKNKYVLLFLIGSLFSCTDGDKAIEFVVEEVERGAVVRTLDLSNVDFDINDLQSTFTINVEEMDIEEGDLLDEVEILVQFKDNTPSNGNSSVPNTMLAIIPAEEWSVGPAPEGLPRTSFVYSYEELLTATGLTTAEVAVKDQFLINLNLKLTDGRVFNAFNASSIIIAFDTFFSSPFCYTINMVEPIAEDLFTGMYLMESILDGPNGQTFVDEFRQPFPDGTIIEVVKGHSSNTREFRAFHNLHHVGLEQPRRWEFTVVDDRIVMGKNQLSSPEGYCSFNAAPTLLGPDTVSGPANINDDTVFELWFVEGYLGFDGECGYQTAPSRYRFSKQ